MKITIRQKQVSKGEKDEQSYDDADDSDNRLEPRSHKENPEYVDDDDDKEEEKVDAKEGNEMGSLEIRTEKMQTPIPTTPRSPRINLSSDKNIVQELTDTVSLSTPTTSKDPYKQRRISKKYSQLPDDLIENNLKPRIAKTIIEDRDAFRSENNVIQVHPTITTSTDTTSSADLQKKLYLKMNRSLQDRANDIALYEEKKYILSLHKIHAERFLEADLEEKINRWVRKKFKKFNEDARLSIQHWKDSWHKRVYKQNQRRVKDNPEDYFSNHGITEVFRITTDQPHGLDFMEQIIMMRENDKPDSFSEADFKYLNKNDIEDLYYLCRNKKVNYRETKLMNSLITFIKSRVIWERVHDFQLGIESYHVKVNLTAPTLTFPGIEAHEPYSIIDKPTTGLIYLNSKDKIRVMYLVEIVKFCNATLEKVLKEVKLKIFQSEPWKKPHLLGKLDRDIMRAFEREITKRLTHREQMRRWESFVNGRQILPMMKRL
ncbi:hypothetical protein Tco_0599471 [Tanacetum coccineum]